MGRQIWIKFLARPGCSSRRSDRSAIYDNVIMFRFLLLVVRKFHWQRVGENGLHRDLFPGVWRLGRREVHARERRARGSASLPAENERGGRYSQAPEFVERVERVEAHCGLDSGR